MEYERNFKHNILNGTKYFSSQSSAMLYLYTLVKPGMVAFEKYIIFSALLCV